MFSALPFRACAACAARVRLRQGEGGASGSQEIDEEFQHFVLEPGVVSRLPGQMASADDALDVLAGGSFAPPRPAALLVHPDLQRLGRACPPRQSPWASSFGIDG